MSVPLHLLSLGLVISKWNLIIDADFGKEIRLYVQQETQ